MKLTEYFNIIDKLITLSHDAETKVGALLLSRETKDIVEFSTNTFIDSSLETKLPNKRPGKYQYIQHAEARLIYQCARYAVVSDNCIVICSHSPCLNCMRILYQAGIDTIYFKEVRKDLDNVNYALDLRGKLTKLKNGYYKLKLSIRR